MTNPTSKGVGTGTAVLDDYSVSNQAVSDFFKTYKQDKEKAQAKKDAQSAERKKAEAQLQGRLGDYDPDKMRVPDKKVALQRYNDIVKKYEGRYAEMVNGGPLLNEYNDDMANYRIFVSDSIESNQGLKDFYAAIHEPDSGYSPEKIKAIDEYALAEGSTVQGLQDSGLYNRDQVIGDPLSKMDDLFRESGKELFKMEENSYVNDKNQIVKYKKQNWLPDNEALPKFKAAISSNPELMGDLQIMYPDLEFDDQVQKFYDEYKTKNDKTVNNYDIGRAPKDTSGGGFWGDKRDKYSWGIAAKGKPTRKGDPLIGDKKDVITIAKGSSTSPLSPITVNGRVGVISEIYKNKKDEWIVVRNITKDDMGTITITGETVEEPYSDAHKSHMESEYNVTDLDQHAKDLWNRKSGKSSDSDMSNAGSKYN